MPPRLPDAKRDEIAEAIKAGGTARGIAREHEVSSSTVIGIARDYGIADAFDRTKTEKACAATKADNEARRAALTQGLLEDAERLRQQLWQPTTVFNFGGRDNTYESRELSEPTFADKRHIAGAVRMLITTSLDLDRHDRGDGTPGSAFDAWLDAMRGSGPEVAA